MPTSEARILANRANSLKSCGPRTAQGRERSSRNSLKHGLTGSGAVVHEQDAAEVEARNQALQAELAPKSAMGADPGPPDGPALGPDGARRPTGARRHRRAGPPRRRRLRRAADRAGRTAPERDRRRPAESISAGSRRCPRG